MTITTPTGRTLTIDHETARTLEWAGQSGAQIDLDIDGLIAGTLSLADLSGICEDGSGDDQTSAGWSAYAHACVRVADAELLARQAS